MSKRKIILIGSIVVIVIIAFVVISPLLKNKNSGGEQNTNPLKNLFNFGGGNNSNNQNPDTNNQPNQPTDQPTTTTNTSIPKLRQITTTPTAGAVAVLQDRPITTPPPSLPLSNGEVNAKSSSSSLTLTKGEGQGGGAKSPVAPKVLTEKSLSVEWVESATGHVFSLFMDKTEPEEMSNTTIPGIHDAHFDATGENVVLRYLNENNSIETFLGHITTELKGIFLPSNIYDISVSPKGDKFFYLFNPVADRTVGIISDFTGTKKSQVFDSVFSEWLSSFISEKSIQITTKASSDINGYSYSINPTTKSFTKLLGGVPGMTALASPDGKYIVYNQGSKNRMGLYLLDTKTNESKDLQLSGAPEKCVWSKDSLYVYCAVPKFLPNGEYPDVWYQGLVNFTDEIWKINISNNFFELVLKPSEITGKSLDIINMFTDADQKFLFFTNKTDSTLWSFDLSV